MMDLYNVLYIGVGVIIFACIFYSCCRRRHRGAVLVPPPTTTIVVPPSQAYPTHQQQTQVPPHYPVQGRQPAFTYTPVVPTQTMGAPYPHHTVLPNPAAPPIRFSYPVQAGYPHHTAAPPIGFSYPTQAGYPHHTAQDPPSYSEAVAQEAYSKQAPFNPAYPTS